MLLGKQIRLLYRTLHTIPYKRQNQLFIHTANDNTKAELSFSQNPSSVAIGTINIPTGTTADVLSEANITSSDFKQNPTFLTLLYDLINDKIDQDFTYMIEAQSCPDSFMPIYDLRSVPRYARTPELENVIGYVRVSEEGKIVPHSFQQNNSYRLVDYQDGVLRLSDFLDSEIKKVVESH